MKQQINETIDNQLAALDANFPSIYSKSDVIKVIEDIRHILTLRAGQEDDSVSEDTIVISRQDLKIQLKGSIKDQLEQFFSSVDWSDYINYRNERFSVDSRNMIEIDSIEYDVEITNVLGGEIGNIVGNIIEDVESMAIK